MTTKTVVALVLVAALGCSAETVDLAVAVGQIGPKGGRIAAPDNAVLLEVPAGALTEATSIRIYGIADNELPEGAVSGTGWRIEPQDLRFAQPATLHVSYRDKNLPRGVTDALALARMADVLRATYQPSVDAIATSVQGAIYSLGSFAAIDLVVADARVETQEHRVTDVDVLFVVDNSSSMMEEQAALAENFARFIEQISDSGLGYHVGVVSTDLGTGPYPLEGGCEQSGGDGGALQAEPRGDCEPPDGSFISVTKKGSNTDDPIAAFSCIAQLGVNGCGFEQPLESMRLALDEPNASGPNAGFLRDNAALAVVFLTDEDDCSATNDELFTTDLDELGPLSSFRCAEYGYLCGGEPISREKEAEYDACAPGQDWLFAVNRYADFLTALKPAGQVVVGAVAGPSDGTITVTLDEGTYANVSASCELDDNFATPGIRIKALVDAFGERGLYRSICDDDFSDVLDVLGQLVVQQTVLSWCLPFAPATVEDCTVEADGLGSLPACSESVEPCWEITPATICDSGVELTLLADPTSLGTSVHISCLGLAPPRPGE